MCCTGPMKAGPSYTRVLLENKKSKIRSRSGPRSTKKEEKRLTAMIRCRLIYSGSPHPWARIIFGVVFRCDLHIELLHPLGLKQHQSCEKGGHTTAGLTEVWGQVLPAHVWLRLCLGTRRGMIAWDRHAIVPWKRRIDVPETCQGFMI